MNVQTIDKLQAEYEAADIMVVSAVNEYEALWRASPPRYEIEAGLRRLQAARQWRDICRDALAQQRAKIKRQETMSRRSRLRRNVTTRDRYRIAVAALSSVKLGLSAALIRRVAEEQGIHPSAIDVEELRKLARQIQEKRAAKAQQRTKLAAEHEYAVRLGECPGITRGRPPVLLPRQRPIDRLNRLRVQEVIAAAKRTTLPPQSDRINYVVSFGDDVDYVINKRLIYPYKGTFKRYSACEYDHHITVPHHWRRSVLERGLAVLSHELTLRADPIPEARNNVEAVIVRAARRTRNFDVEVVIRFYARVRADASWVRITMNQLTPTVAEIRRERNTEVRRVMIAAYGGLDAFMRDAKAKVVARDDVGELLQIGEGAEPIKAVRLVCPTTGRVYVEAVPPHVQTPRDAVAWQFGLSEYAPTAES